MWQPDSWQQKIVFQQPRYENPDHFREILTQIHSLPPLVYAREVEALRTQIAEASEGRRFILQGGDCAERFVDCTSQRILSKLKILLQMSIIMAYGGRRPIVPIGRIAGQYAKPRSNENEWVHGELMPSFRGDNVNAFSGNLEQRKPNPARLLEGYHRASLTLNFIRSLNQGGFLDVNALDGWEIDDCREFEHLKSYRQLKSRIEDALDFFQKCHGFETKGRFFHASQFFISHEGLLLGLEQALTRFVPERRGYFNLGAHMLWIGDRTRQLDAGHVEFFRGIENPIAVKIGPNHQCDEIAALVRILNPAKIPGRLSLITRFGEKHVESALAPLIRSVQKTDIPVAWLIDPMHGNAQISEGGIKTRDFDAILFELRAGFAIHAAEKSRVAGVHFELSGENVTECIGGSEKIRLSDLDRNYESYCDPRLNYKQSLEMAFILAQMLA